MASIVANLPPPLLYHGRAANLFDPFVLAKLLSNADEIIGSKIPVLVPLDHTIEKRWVGVGVGMAE